MGFIYHDKNKIKIGQINTKITWSQRPGLKIKSKLAKLSHKITWFIITTIKIKLILAINPLK